jgi:hypothetical protein
LEHAIGCVLAHDITEIRPGEFKGARFKKGHVIAREDIPLLKRLGKEHIFVLELGSGELHEDDAALRLASAFCGENVEYENSPSEGKIALRAKEKGLLKVNVDALTKIAMIPEMCLSTLYDN